MAEDEPAEREDAPAGESPAGDDTRHEGRESDTGEEPADSGPEAGEESSGSGSGAGEEEREDLESTGSATGADDEPLRVEPAPVEPEPRVRRTVLPPERRVSAPIGAVRAANQAALEARQAEEGVPQDVQKYDRFKKVDGAQYERVNEFLRERTYITAREWAIARLCSDFRTETGIEMTKIGENLPHLVPFMTDTYTPQAVNQARSSFETKVKKSGATFLYGAMSDFFRADELDDIMYEVTEVAKFLLEVEGVDLAVDEELEGEERISSVMREVRAASDELRHEGTTCPNCGHEIGHD
jgi:hypothetical protein